MNCLRPGSNAVGPRPPPQLSMEKWSSDMQPALRRGGSPSPAPQRTRFAPSAPTIIAETKTRGAVMASRVFARYAELVFVRRPQFRRRDHALCQFHPLRTGPRLGDRLEPAAVYEGIVSDPSIEPIYIRTYQQPLVVERGKVRSPTKSVRWPESK